MRKQLYTIMITFIITEVLGFVTAAFMVFGVTNNFWKS